MQKKFEEYAKLLVEVGVNVQKGQNLVISCPVDCAWFARMCAKAAYAAGCREVVMSWGDELLTREKYLHAADDVFDSVPEWRVRFSTDYAKEGAAFLHIGGSDPEILKGVEQDRLVRSSRSSGAALKEYRQLQMSNAVPWSIGAIPVPSWAKKVFPDCPEEEAMAKLWDAILTSVRVTGDGKAVERWKEHLDTLQIRIDKLNALRLESLHYTNSLGTDLTIRLPEDHIWGGGDGTSRAGIPCIARPPPGGNSLAVCGLSPRRPGAPHPMAGSPEPPVIGLAGGPRAALEQAGGSSGAPALQSVRQSVLDTCSGSGSGQVRRKKPPGPADSGTARHGHPRPAAPFGRRTGNLAGRRISSHTPPGDRGTPAERNGAELGSLPPAGRRVAKAAPRGRRRPADPPCRTVPAGYLRAAAQRESVCRPAGLLPVSGGSAAHLSAAPIHI